MVHALDEIRRTLKPNGILIDLRPVEVKLVGGDCFVGGLAGVG